MLYVADITEVYVLEGCIVMRQEKLSIIVPVYNVEKYINRCLSSIVNQTYENLDIIIIDDGSPDNCGSICDEYAAKDSRIKVIHKCNEGVSIARNIGINNATGQWITFVDSDDWIEADYYENIFDTIKDRDVDIMYSGGYIWEFEKRTITRKGIKHNFCYHRQIHIEKWKDLFAKIVEGNVASEDFETEACEAVCWNKIYRRQFLIENKILFLPDLYRHEDILFNLLAVEKADVVAGCTYIGYHYRKYSVDSDSATSGYNVKCHMNVKLFLENLYCCEIGQRGYVPENEKACAALRAFRNALFQYYFNTKNKNYKKTKDELREMKQNPYILQAMQRDKISFMPKTSKILKFALHIPGIWPIKFFFELYNGYLCVRKHLYLKW